jgi:hypothetical protein
MDDARAALEMVDRIVRDARIPGRTAREGLRRELVNHFEDAGQRADGLSGALHRFGPEQALTEAFRRVYAADYHAMYAVKVAASIVASTAVALAVLVAVHWLVSLDSPPSPFVPGFSGTSLEGFKIILASAAAWEILRRPFDLRRVLLSATAYFAVAIPLRMALGISLHHWHFWNVPAMVAIGFSASRLTRPWARWMVTFAGFVAVLYVSQAIHVLQFDRRTMLVTPPLINSARMMLVWLCVAAILPRCDRLFLGFFGLPNRRA